MRTALVTGATRGIGRAIVEELARAGMRVIVTGRDTAAGSEVARAIGDQAVFRSLDQTSEADIDAIAASTDELDVLVNNAGTTFDGFDATVARKTLDANFVGMMKLTDRLLPRVRAGGRIVMVSSGMGQVDCLSPALREEVMSPTLDRAGLLAFADRFVADVARGDHTKRGWPTNAYRISKVTMNAYVRILARELAADPRGILVNATCPGWVRTNMGGSSAPRSPAQGAETPVWLAQLPDGGPHGGFFRDKQPIEW